MVSWQLVAISLLGIALIGIVNLAVSFGLALYVAMKARQVRFNRIGELFRMLGARFMSNPREFFFLPETELHYKIWHLEQNKAVKWEEMIGRKRWLTLSCARDD